MASSDIDLRLGEEVVLQRGAGYFPSKALFCHGGTLYLTSARLVFRPLKLDRALSRRDSAIELELPDITAVGSTPKWGSFPARPFLRLDDRSRSYLFLFSAFRPRWRPEFVAEVTRLAPSARLLDGWGHYG